MEGGYLVILGDRRFVEIPGDKTHELPPLLLTRKPHQTQVMLHMAKQIVESEDLLPLSEELPEKRAGREMDLALNLAEQYQDLKNHWQWGDSVLGWIKQCETTFSQRIELRNILNADLWPHAGRQSFVELLTDKQIATDNVSLPQAVGLRLTFRQLPSIKCFSDLFLLYLNQRVSPTAYDSWTAAGKPSSSLPPERFHFQVIETSLDL